MNDKTIETTAVEVKPKKGFGENMGNALDKVVGDVLLGGLGRIGYHVGKVPGIGATGAYIKENVSDGFHAAEEADQKRKALAAIKEIETKGVNLTPEGIASLAKKVGIDPTKLDEVRKAAVQQAAKILNPKGDIPVPGHGTYAAPA